LKNNTVCNGNEYAGNGVEIEHSLFNMITDCRICNNGGAGVSLVSSVMNNIYRNDFIGNRMQTYIYESTSNLWDCGYPSGGNYWSDYNGSDLFWGTYQNMSGSDGVGDTKYIIDANNTDRFPLMKPWAPPDIALLDLTTSKTIVGQGLPVQLNVTVENQGNKVEGFAVDICLNESLFHSENFTLTSGNSTFTTTWNTTGFAYGNYTVSAYALPVPGETNTDDNNMTGGSVLVTIPGDINGDGTVNILDAITLSNAFLTTPNSSNWNPNADINDDNVVNILDAIILANHFLQHYP
jgi:parallel beta-helix repeat protein